MPVHVGSASNHDERFPPPRPERSQRNSKRLVQAVNRVRGRCVCKASSCRRRAKFSRTRSSRERKGLTTHPRRCRSDTIIARILSELSEFSFALSHSFCRCTTFWRDTSVSGTLQEARLAVLVDGLHAKGWTTVRIDQNAQQRARKEDPAKTRSRNCVGAIQGWLGR